MIEFFGGLVLGLIIGVGGCLALVAIALFTYEKIVDENNTENANRLEIVLREFEDAGRRAALSRRQGGRWHDDCN